MDLTGMGCESVNWIQMAPDRVNTVMKVRAGKNVGNFLTI
jgi:hypothetical protein